MNLQDQQKTSGQNYTACGDASARNTHAALCLLVLIVGAAVRLYNLGGESIDLEEYACLSGIDAPTYSVFFQEQRELYPYGAPLAPTLIYFWTRLAGDSIVCVRLLFAWIGILVMLSGYLVARLLFSPTQISRRAGLIVLLCVALSPVHVFHSQEARMYALVSFFALLGMASFLMALKSGRRGWWWLHLLANAAIVASHYFSVFLLPVYGIALLSWERRLSLRAVWWGAGHCLIVVALFVWVRAIPPQAEELYSYYAAPTVHTVLVHLLAGDSTTLSATSFFPSGLSWSFLPDAVRQWIYASHVFFDGLLIFMSLVSLAGGLVLCIRGAFSAEREIAWRWLTLLTWAILPVFLIMALSFLWRPVYGSRYVMYGMFAFYLLAGGVISHFPRRSCYAALTALIALTYGYQLSIALPAQTRSAWRHAYEKVQIESDNNAVLLLEDPFWLPVLVMNTGSPPPVPIVAAFERNTLCEAASLLADTPSAFSVVDTPDIWLLPVLTTDFDEVPFIACLENNGLQFKRFYYPGERNLALYRISWDPERVLSGKDAIDTDLFKPLISGLTRDENAHIFDAATNEIKYLPDGEGGFWLRLGMEMAIYRKDMFSTAAFHSAAIASLNAAMRMVEITERLDETLDVDRLAHAALQLPGREPCERLRAFMQAAFYSDNIEFVEALGHAQRTKTESCCEPYVYLGIAAHRRREHHDAVLWFRTCSLVEEKAPPEVVEAYGISLTEIGEYHEAVTVLQKGIKAFPGYYWLYMRLGIANAALGNHEEAIEALRISHEHAPDNDFIVFLLIERFLALGRYEEAASFAKHPAVVPSPEPWVLMARWRAYTGTGDDTEGARVFSRLQKTETVLKPFYQHLYIAPNPEEARALLAAYEAQGHEIFPEIYMLLERLERQH